MKKIVSGVPYFLILLLILLGVLAACSASTRNDPADQRQSNQPATPVVTVYKAPT